MGKHKEKLLVSIEVAKDLLKNFIDIDEVISPKGRRPFYVPTEEKEGCETPWWCP